MNSFELIITEFNLRAATPDNLQRLARYLTRYIKVDSWVETETVSHEQLAWLVSMIIADQYLDSCDNYIARM
jgi:hypothetical protein